MSENRFGVVVHQGQIAILGAVAILTKPAGTGLFERLKFDGMSADDAINLATWLIVKANAAPAKERRNSLSEVIIAVRHIEGTGP